MEDPIIVVSKRRDTDTIHEFVHVIGLRRPVLFVRYSTASASLLLHHW